MYVRDCMKNYVCFARSIAVEHVYKLKNTLNHRKTNIIIHTYVIVMDAHNYTENLLVSFVCEWQQCFQLHINVRNQVIWNVLERKAPWL